MSLYKECGLFLSQQMKISKEIVTFLLYKNEWFLRRNLLCAKFMTALLVWWSGHQATIGQTVSQKRVYCRTPLFHYKTNRTVYFYYSKLSFVLITVDSWFSLGKRQKEIKRLAYEFNPTSFISPLTVWMTQTAMQSWKSRHTFAPASGIFEVLFTLHTRCITCRFSCWK